MKDPAFLTAASLADGPSRVAALAAWVQSLGPDRESPPVLVGGAAVELYSGGAYRTGDLDFVGSLGPQASERLAAVGFEKHGRHWIHEEHKIFLEFPGAALAEGERVTVVEVDGHRVLTIGLEELVVDRLAAWQFWRSEVDGVNAFLLVRAATDAIDWSRVREAAGRAGVLEALGALTSLAHRNELSEVTAEELETWSRNVPGGSK